MDENENANAYVGTIKENYEAGWHRQKEIIMELENENKRLRDTIIGMCKSLYEKEGAEE